jgi:hypothetical protein
MFSRFGRNAGVLLEALVRDRRRFLRLAGLRKAVRIPGERD